MPGSRNTREQILHLLETRGSATGPELAKSLGITRQAVSHHTKALLIERQITKTGSTRAARYYPADAELESRKIARELELAGLDESLVYVDLALALNLGRLRDNVESIVHYAFTEMLNNAIDHSRAQRCLVEVSVDASRVRFRVRDQGIGVYHSIASKLDLADEREAMVELIKGKTTTMPEVHSGEGIFFVSRAADRFVLRSHRIQLEWDQFRDDVFASDTKLIRGTLVEFEIGRTSRRRLEKVFEAFAPGNFDYRFEKTQVFVKLLGDAYVSRSEARRLLHGLEKFSEIELDMRGVKIVGQGFVDEVFRVFAKQHPGISIRATRTRPTVEAMIRRI